MLGGAVLAYLAITQMVPADRAVDPNQMYLAAYNFVFPNYGWAVAATALFVVVSQLKINVTNAYAGSLAWSNFFSRLTHSHPGRVVWVVFNTLIAFMLMEMNVFQALGQVLGLYSNIAIAWIMAVVADLVVNKPLGLSPKGIEFKRAHLYDINPVGVGAMGLASVLSFVAHLGLLGPMAQAFSALIAMVTAFVAAPLIAWATRGRYYIARESAPALAPEGAALSPRGCDGAYLAQRLQRCVICEREYEGPDMAHCPAYQGAICSLCCTLDARCGDLCKPHARLWVQWSAALRHVLPRSAWPYLEAGLAHYLLLMLVLAPLLAAVLGLLYRQEVQGLLAGVGMAWDSGLPPSDAQGHAVAGQLAMALGSSFLRVYAALLLVLGLVAWWLVLAHKSREVAQVESNRQTELLMQEIESHRRTDEQLQHAREAAERAREVAEQARAAADHANQAKTRYISTISHELRTPLNSILGYAQMLHEDLKGPGDGSGGADQAPQAPHRAQAIKVIHRGGEHLLSIIEGTLDIARIESGKLTLAIKPMAFADGVAEMAHLFELQARAKGLDFRFEPLGKLPLAVRADDKRVRQILINLLGNAVKFTQRGRVLLRASYAREMAQFEVVDSGPGMSAQDIERVFEPFARGSTGSQAQGSGLGLTIAKMLTDLMGGELTVTSQLGEGTTFRVRLFLPELRDTGTTRPAAALAQGVARTGYTGERRRVLVVDNEESDRDMLQRWLQPLGFDVMLATSGHDALRLLGTGYRPHAIFMDLAMPGIDGWETLRRVQALGLGVPAAIVSANAFDQALDNDVGITPADFLVKPVRRDDLLDWLGRKLGLTWLREGSAPAAALAPPAGGAAVAWWPAPEERERLLHRVQLGHVRGVGQQLDAIEAAPVPASQGQARATFLAHARALLKEFQLDALERWLVGAAPAPATPTESGDFSHASGPFTR